MPGQASARSRSAGREREVSGWAVGLIFSAAIVMFIGGIAQFFAGLAAVLGNVPYAFTSGNQLLDFNLTTWGWIHLLVGLGVALAGVAVWLGQVWARVVAVILVLASAVTSFLFIPHYPFWSLAIIALDVFAIWALTAHGRDAAA
jgi:hypothetical protein